MFVSRRGSGLVLRLVIAALMVAAGRASPLWAADGIEGAEGNRSRLEVWIGAQTFPNTWSIYTGATYAPFGGGLAQDGFRLRAVAGQGAFSYVSQATKFHDQSQFADVLAGYHRQLGALTLKAFAGLAAVAHQTDDPRSPIAGTSIGPKALVEAWWNVTDQAWTSLDLSGGTLHNLGNPLATAHETAYGSRLRLGWRVKPELSAGLEGGAAGELEGDAAGDEDRHSGRVGAFARYEWGSGEISLSGGWSVIDPFGDRSSSDGPFATVNLLTRF